MMYIFDISSLGYLTDFMFEIFKVYNIGLQNAGIKKSEFVAKTQILWSY